MGVYLERREDVEKRNERVKGCLERRRGDIEK
jgi:hypothetical protein